jgi:hypothetical protein
MKLHKSKTLDGGGGSVGRDKEDKEDFDTVDGVKPLDVGNTVRIIAKQAGGKEGSGYKEGGRDAR